MHLKEVYFSLFLNYTQDKKLIEEFWEAIFSQYNSPKRYYHHIFHLEQIYQELQPIQHLIKDWNTTLFALFYHDFEYDVLKNDNEELSAQKAIEVMNILSLPSNQIYLCQEMILATKGHTPQLNSDINCFLDADINILGKPFDVYQQYSADIRNEYIHYANDIYYNGRKNILLHFLNKEKIYNTDYFSALYERQARVNIQAELILIEEQLNPNL